MTCGILKHVQVSQTDKVTRCCDRCLSSPLTMVAPLILEPSYRIILKQWSRLFATAAIRKQRYVFVHLVSLLRSFIVRQQSCSILSGALVFSFLALFHAFIHVI